MTEGLALLEEPSFTSEELAPFALATLSQELKTHYVLNNLVESPIITLEQLISETQCYDGKKKLIEKAINKKILSLCHRDIQMVNLMIDYLCQIDNLDKETKENNLLDLIISWKHID